MLDFFLQCLKQIKSQVPNIPMRFKQLHKLQKITKYIFIEFKMGNDIHTYTYVYLIIKTFKVKKCTKGQF